MPHGWAAMLLLLASGGAVSSCGEKQSPVPAAQPRDRADEGGTQVVILALSKGQGVPDAARAARDQARTELQRLREQRLVVSVQETPIGIEGERRICATFATARDAEETASRLRSMSKGVELFNIAVEPCPTSNNTPLPQGVKP